MSDRSNRLAVIGAEIVSAHKAAAELEAKAMERAVEAGRLLIEAKDLVPHGQWLPWLKENVGFSERTAQNYMRLARLPEANPHRVRISDMSIKGALRYLGHVEAIPLPGPGQYALGEVTIRGRKTSEGDDAMRIVFVWPAKNSPGWHIYDINNETGISSCFKKPVPDVAWLYDSLCLGGFPFDLGVTWQLIERADREAFETFEDLRLAVFSDEERRWAHPYA